MADISVIATRQDSKIKEKHWIWKLIADSYAGGTQYIKAGYLERHPREGLNEYKARLKRAVYFNHVQPLADVLSGFIYTDQPKREIPAKIDYIKTQCSKKKSLDSFMFTVAIHSLQHTVGILVDAPDFDPQEIRSIADRKKRGLNPYCVMYMPWQIRDYAADDNGELLWVLLDNTYTEKDNPLSDPTPRKVYRLWTREMWADFEIKAEDNGSQGAQESSVMMIRQQDHKLGIVPFHFLNWRDLDEDLITESPFEDIALCDRAIFNNMSYMDEMLAGGTFKMLFFPVKSIADLKPVEAEGMGQLSVIPFPHDSKNKPYFDGAKLEDVASFISAMEFYLKEIFRKVGLDKDEDKRYVQSGEAKSIEFQKCEALLRMGAEALEVAEVWIMETMGLWEGIDLKGKAKVTYAKKFQSDEIMAELGRLYEAFAMPFKTMKKQAAKEISRKVFPELDQKTQEEMEAEIDKEIDSAPSMSTLNANDLAKQEEGDRQPPTSDDDNE